MLCEEIMRPEIALKAGDTCYSQHGQEALFVAKSGAQFIVRPLYEDDYGPHEGEVETWGAAFRTPPAPKLDAETKTVEKQLAALRQELRQLRTERLEFDADSKARMERIKQHKGLELLDRYLAGEITHYVATHDYYPTVAIIPVGETVDSYQSSNGYGLLTLMPSRSWDKRIAFSVTYREQRSYDSRTKTVIPCCGEAEAKAVAAEWIAQKVADYLALEPVRRNYVEQLFAACLAHSVAIPQQLIDEHNALKHKQALEHRAKIQQQLSEIDAQLNALGKPYVPGEKP